MTFVLHYTHIQKFETASFLFDLKLLKGSKECILEGSQEVFTYKLLWTRKFENFITDYENLINLGQTPIRIVNEWSTLLLF